MKSRGMGTCPGSFVFLKASGQIAIICLYAIILNKKIAKKAK